MNRFGRNAILRGGWVAAWLALGAPALAQDTSPPADTLGAPPSRWILPASESEDYLRYLQTLGLVRPYPWSVRGFSSKELRTLRPASASHPWATAPWLRGNDHRLPLGVRVSLAPAELHARYNTTFPYGMNDGAVWAGRGLTTSATLGAAAEWGPLTLTLAPVAFWAENRAFPLTPVTGTRSPYQDPLWPDVDRPQRFGDGSYARLDAGNSSARIDLLGVTAGISNANEWWGPMSEFPLILGNNAAGFAHVFAGSSKPWNVLIGRMHGSVLYGVLQPSAFNPRVTGDPRRFAAGMVATFEPRFMPGLELGATRFYHVQWPDTGGVTKEHFTLLFESFLKARRRKVFVAPGGANTDNQLASLFARWVLPRSGFELYGEYGREDHNADARDAILEPDHAAAYGIGARKAWGDEKRLTALRVEIVNFQNSTLSRHRATYAWYRHTFTQQGHTNRGQLLAAGIGVGSGAGGTVVLERLTDGGSAAASWSRYVVQDYLGTVDDVGVQHALRFQRGTRMSDALELRTAIEGIFAFNRTRGNDRGNARVELSCTWHP